MGTGVIPTCATCNSTENALALALRTVSQMLEQSGVHPASAHAAPTGADKQNASLELARRARGCCRRFLLGDRASTGESCTASNRSTRAPHTRVAFPFNMRWLMAIWNAMFLDTQPFQPVAGKSAE